MWRTLLNGYQYVLLVYFPSLNILYALFSCIGLRVIVVVSDGSEDETMQRLIEAFALSCPARTCAAPSGRSPTPT